MPPPSRQPANPHPPYIKLPLKSFGAGAMSQMDNMYVRCDVIFALAPHLRDAFYVLWEHNKRLSTVKKKRKDKIANAGLDDMQSSPGPKWLHKGAASI